MKLKQAELVRENIYTIVWIPSKFCKKNNKLIAKKGTKWKVLAAYTIIELEVDDINHGWKVGGL